MTRQALKHRVSSSTIAKHCLPCKSPSVGLSAAERFKCREIALPCAHLSGSDHGSDRAH